LKIHLQVKEALSEMFQLFPPREGQILIVGCSTSEILGARIGTASNLQVAEEVFGALLETQETFSFKLAFQCCEHLNRAVLVERELQIKHCWDEVLAIPKPHAGGALAAYAYTQMRSPCLISSILADYGMDIGDTLIGMHLRRVAVPVRVSIKTVGQANLVLARTRPPYTGGKRAEYPEERG
jgi:uncharacterized protein (TIGR01440 family)